jgi:hypothetical protein
VGGLGAASYQWQADDSGDANFANLSGATSSTYTLTSNEAGDDVRVQETLADNGGSRTVSSVAVSIEAASGAPNLLNISTAPTTVDAAATHQGDNDWDIVLDGNQNDRAVWNLDGQLAAGTTYTFTGSFEVDNPEGSYIIRSSNDIAIGSTDGNLLEFISPIANTLLEFTYTITPTATTDYIGFRIQNDDAGAGS